MVLLNSKKINGSYVPPGDKSISHRIVILSSQAVGKSIISNLLQSDDVINTVKVMRQLGSNIKKINNQFIIYGLPPGGLFQPSKKLDFGNSGTSIRLIAGLISTNNIKAKLIGDKSLSSRPMIRVTKHLERLGAIFKLRRNDFLPGVIQGSPNPIPLSFDIDIPSAQIKSAIILSALNIVGKIKIKEFASTRDHSERMLKSMNYDIKYLVRGKHRFITMTNKKELKPLDYNVPGDPSSAAFMITAACLKPGSKIVVRNMLYNQTRNGFLKTLKKMGGNIVIKNKRSVHNEIIADIYVNQRKNLKAIKVSATEIPQQIDEIPILSIAAAFANGETIFNGLKELTVKESDRLSLIYLNLKKIGVKCAIKNYDLHIHGSNNLKKGGANIIHNFDHRILMSFYISNLICLKSNKITDKLCVKTSYPEFFEDFKMLLG